MTQETVLPYDLSNKFLLDEIANSFNDKIVGETNNKKMIFLSCISKDLPSVFRQSVIVSSSSSSGKSNLINSILEIFSKDVIDHTDFTTSFFMRSNPNLNGKILKLEQMEKTNDRHQVSLGILKHQLSEGKTKIGLSERDKDGKWQPTDHEVNGIPIFVSTTTNPQIDLETMNRAWLLQLDESIKQTESIKKHTLLEYSKPKFFDSWNDNVIKNKILVEHYERYSRTIDNIYLPYSNQIDSVIPSNTVEFRRDLKKILNLTSTIAFIHYQNRIHIRDNNGKNIIKDQYGNTEKTYSYSIISDIADFNEALEIGQQAIKQTMNKVNESTLDVLQVVRERNNLNNNEGIGLSDVAKELHLSESRTREKLNQGREAGLIVSKREGHAYCYFPSEKNIELIKPNDIDFTKEDVEKWFKLNFPQDRFELKYPYDPS
ncbi:MAG: DNA primase [Crenarchaeota archaeon]|nr:DNA primase [Thermoproteota archaeon]